MDPTSKKRKAGADERHDGSHKKTKGKKQWDMPRRGGAGAELRAIQPGDSGIWATCGMKKEAKSVPDLRSLFEEYASKLYNSEALEGEGQDEEAESEVADIEAEIQKELAEMRKPASKPLFTSVKLETQCLIFFRTRSPIEPVSFVEKICLDAAAGVQQNNCRFVKRLTPITSFEKATTKGLEAVAKRVLAPHFHVPDQTGKKVKFAIRPSIRNNKEFTRDGVIKTIAAAVGPGHKVDLHGYDLLILVEIYQNVVGMSVVNANFEKLKRFNLEELRQMNAADSPEPKGPTTIIEDE